MNTAHIRAFGRAMQWQTEMERHFYTEDAMSVIFAYMCNQCAASLRSEEPAQVAAGNRVESAPAKPSKRAGAASKTPLVVTPTPRVRMDPVSTATALMISDPVRLVLSETGIALFKNHTRYVFPYRLMSHEQRASIVRCIGYRDEWSTQHARIVFKNGASHRLPPLLCLQAMHIAVIASKQPAAEEDRLAIYNLVLQRVQPILSDPAGVHASLNQWAATRRLHANAPRAKVGL